MGTTIEAHAQRTTDSTGLARQRTELAGRRTRLAYERTLMAWVRTSTALISFAFTIYKFFQYLHESGQKAASTHRIDPREFAMVMIAFSIVVLLAATVSHRKGLRELARDQDPKAPRPRSLATFVAFMVCVLGAAGLVVVILRQ